MTFLKKLTLSNIRRFSENVEIDISEGATIILAPNGTGKTSIFEAIEFALTGAIKRLDHPPTPIIRDRFDSARIRLDYDDDKFCEVNFHKGSDPIIRHEHPTLFGGIESGNISYLLRLTHLLSQSSKDWFVQSKSDEAATQLDSLSIGKDATIANSSVSGLKRAAGNVVERLQQDFDKVNNEFERWRELQQRRITAISPSNQNLTPRQLIIKEIVAIEDGLFPQGIVDELPIIKSIIAQLRNRYSQADFVANHKIVSFSQLKTGISGFTKLLKDRDSAERRLAEKAGLLDTIDKRILENNERATEHRKILTEKHAEIQQRQDLKELIFKLAELASKTSPFEAEKGKVEDDVRLLQNEHKQKIEEAEAVKNKIAVSNNLTKDKLQLLERKRQQDELNEVLKKWNQAQKQIDEQNLNALPLAETQLSSIDLQLELKNSGMQGKRDLLKVAQNVLNNLIDTSDKLKAAVSAVAENLAADTNQCPVCSSEFQEGELQKEIAKSLSKLDEGLEPAHAAVRTAKKEFEDFENEVSKLRDNHAEAANTVQQVKDVITLLSRQINNDFKPKFQGKDYDTAREYFENQETELLISQRDVIGREIILGEVPSQSVQDLLDEQARQIQQRLIAANERQRLAASNLAANQKEINSIQLRVSQRDHVDNDLKLEAAQKLYSSTNIDFEKIQEAIRTDNAQSKLEQEGLSNIDVELRAIKSRIDEQLSIWVGAGFTGTPEIQILELAIAEQQDIVTKNKDRATLLGELLAEIIKWEAYESYFAIESDIRNVIGQSTEDEYLSSLSARHEKQRLKFESATRKVAVINNFSRSLDTELKTVNEKLASINPIWGKILKRLVIDPRFASTALNSYQYYRKNYADVHVPLHDNGALVSQVASEAQITDIQFSFLLAMAQMYQWSPWKALLLDDPTQHHDLVHASAVFDLLRDYIADYRFQVLMATHDTVQAKFFRRKLENDGIRCSFYVLNATRSGVVAERN